MKLVVTDLSGRANAVDIRIYDQHIDTNVREVECVLRMVETRITCNFFNNLIQRDSTVHRVVYDESMVFYFREEGSPD